MVEVLVVVTVVMGVVIIEVPYSDAGDGGGVGCSNGDVDSGDIGCNDGGGGVLVVLMWCGVGLLQ